MVDLTVAAIPFYFATMGAEARWHAKRRVPGTSQSGDYERDDTLTSLAMGVGSLLAPLVSKPLMKKFDLRAGRWARTALAVTAAAGATALVADAVVRNSALEPGRLPAPDDPPDDPAATRGTATRSGSDSVEESDRGRRSRRLRRLARRIAGSASLVTIAGAGAVVAGTWANRTAAERMWRRRLLPDWGTGPLAAVGAVFAWDAIYYWNHRIQHEARYLWAIHVVHHSSERYNLSTALRQPVSDALGTFVPYGLLSLLGCRPALIEQARGVNLIYQYWIHTEVIRSLGPLESVLNTPSHHRVHHGSNRQYLDRNHGSILIIWDKLFGTFEPESEPVRYGLTRNIETFNPLRVATHEYADMAHDVVNSDNWTDRLSYVVRGPGWAYERRAALGVGQPPGAEAPHVADELEPIPR